MLKTLFNELLLKVMQVQDVSSTGRNDYITFYKLHFLVNTFIENSDESIITLIKKIYIGNYKVFIYTSLHTKYYVN